MRALLMRTIGALLALPAIVATPATAQDYAARGLAVQSLAALGNLRAGPDIMERCQREGEPFTTYGNNGAGTSVAAGSGNTVLSGTQTAPTIGKVFFLAEATGSIDGAAIVQLVISPDSNTRFNGLTYQKVTPAAGGDFVVHPNVFLRAFQFQNGAVSLNVRYNPNGAATTYRAGVWATGCKFTDDLNWGASKTILGFGDSTWNGTGPTQTANMLPFIIRDYYRAKGIDVRLVLKSGSGSTSNDHEAWRKAGWWDGVPADMGLYSLCINDAGVGTSTTTYLANITAAWTYFHAQHPRAPFIIFGCAPIENSTADAVAATLRTTAATYVTGVGSPLLRYINLGTAFDRTVASFYATSDVAGSRVHANDAGHAAEGAVVTAALTAQGITIP